MTSIRWPRRSRNGDSSPRSGKPIRTACARSRSATATETRSGSAGLPNNHYLLLAKTLSGILTAHFIAARPVALENVAACRIPEKAAAYQAKTRTLLAANVNLRGREFETGDRVPTQVSKDNR